MLLYMITTCILHTAAYLCRAEVGADMFQCCLHCPLCERAHQCVIVLTTQQLTDLIHLCNTQQHRNYDERLTEINIPVTFHLGLGALYQHRIYQFRNYFK